MTFKQTQPENKDIFLDTDSGWYLSSVFPVRSAGFPYEWLEHLQCHTTARFADTTATAIEQLQHFGRTIRVQLAACRIDNPKSAQVHHLRRIEQCIRKLKPIAEQDKDASFDQGLQQAIDEWNQKVANQRELFAQANAAWMIELTQVEKTLRNIVQNEQFMEAVFLSSPSMEEALQRYLYGQLKTGERRYIMLKLVRYIQRMCAKNETSSFFGPIAYGTLCKKGPSLKILGEVGGLPSTRKTFFAHWAAQVLANMWNNETTFEAEQYAMRSAHLALNTVQGILTPIEHDILSRADGTKSLREIAQDINHPLSEVVAQARTLASGQLLLLGFLLDSYAPDGLDELHKLLNKMQTDKDDATWKRWEKIVASLQQIRDSFAYAKFPERVALLHQAESIFSVVSGLPSRRGAGQHYADRFLLYEECAAPFSISIGGKLAHVLPKVLAPSLTAVAHSAVKKRFQQRQKIHHVYQNMMFNEAFPLTSVPGATFSNNVQVQEDNWLTLVQERLALSNKVISFSKSDLGSLALSGVVGLFVAPDIMIAAKDREAIERGDYQIILGEAQHVLPMSSLPLMIFYHTKDAAAQEVNDAIQRVTASAQPAIFALERKTKGLDIVPLDGMVVIQPQWLKSVSSARSVAYGDLVVKSDATGRWELQVDGVHEALNILPHYEDQGNPKLPEALAPFTLPAVDKQPIVLAQHTPRIEVDGVVWQRERWDLQKHAESLPDDCRDFQAYLKLWQWKRLLRLPDQVFAQTPDEPKPWLIDFLSPLSCAVFLQMIRVSSSFVLTEMLPRPDELWLRGPNGRYTCELRLTAFWDAERSSMLPNEKEGKTNGHA